MNTMCRKITVLEEAFTGYFTDHHAFLLDRMLDRVDAITGDIADLDARMEEQITRSPRRCAGWMKCLGSALPPRMRSWPK